MTVNQQLLVAVERLRAAETEVINARKEVASLFEQAARTQPITSLARLTRINRTTIYWLIRVWSNDGNKAGSSANAV